MRKNLAADRPSITDHGMETFSYDDAHLAAWQMSEGLAETLPQSLVNSIVDWQCAGAAVCTALDRIKKLDDDSIYRGWPGKATHEHLSRRLSVRSSTVASGADTPPLSSPEYAQPVMAPPLDRIHPIDPLPRRSFLGMDSPPFTPSDSQACNTPELPPPDVPLAAVPDMHQLARRLSPLSATPRRDSAAGPAFDESAWETYLNMYRAELYDICSGAWPRFLGCARTVDRLRAELTGISADFDAWWTKMRGRTKRVENRVDNLDVPTLELVRMERVAQGLSV